MRVQALLPRPLTTTRLVPIAASVAAHVLLVGVALTVVSGEPRGRVIFLDLTELPTPPPEAAPRVEPPPPPKPAARTLAMSTPVPAPPPAPTESRPRTLEPEPPTPATVPNPAPPVEADTRMPAAPPAATGLSSATSMTTAPVAPSDDTLAAAAPSGPLEARSAPRPSGPAVASVPADGITRKAIPRGGYQYRPAYPASARRQNIQGTTLLAVLVADDGRVAEIVVKESAGHRELDEAATEAVRRWRFEPARRGADPVAMWVVLPVEFRLR